jgi:ketosteroid isomerase-like protein
MSARSSLPLQSLARALATVAAAIVMLQGCAVATRENAASSAAVVAELTVQADRWDQAIVRKDRAAIEANMAEDFRQIDGAGNVETKSSFVTDLVSPDLVIDPYRVENFDVRVYGDVALLSGTTRMTGRYEGKPFASHYRYIDIYVRRDGTWRIVSVQISRIPGPAAAAP